MQFGLWNEAGRRLGLVLMLLSLGFVPAMAQNKMPTCVSLDPNASNGIVNPNTRPWPQSFMCEEFNLPQLSVGILVYKPRRDNMVLYKFDEALQFPIQGSDLVDAFHRTFRYRDHAVVLVAPTHPIDPFGSTRFRAIYHPDRAGSLAYDVIFYQLNMGASFFRSMFTDLILGAQGMGKAIKELDAEGQISMAHLIVDYTATALAQNAPATVFDQRIAKAISGLPGLSPEVIAILIQWAIRNHVAARKLIDGSIDRR